MADLARAQNERGHAVGIIADATTGGDAAERTLASLANELPLGVSRVAMSRHVGPGDVGAVRHVAARARETGAGILHGHGAKGGAYARLTGGGAIRAYTPHGGSLHYTRGNPVGFAYLAAESLLLRRTDLALFESDYARLTFESKIGRPSGISRVVHNGLRPEEFEPVHPAPGAADILFVGELRALKGVDVLLDALAILKANGTALRALIVGDGPDRAAFEARAFELNLAEAVTFASAMPAREAFGKGRVLVVPSRAESLPYIVLEAAAAGMPVIATHVGGIPEIFGADRSALLAPDDAQALAAAIEKTLPAGGADLVQRLRERVAEKFTVSAMAERVLASYGDAAQKRAI